MWQRTAIVDSRFSIYCAATPNARPMFNPANRSPGLFSTALELPDAKLNLRPVLARKYDRAIDLLAAALAAYGRQGNPGPFRVRLRRGMLQIYPDPASSTVRTTGPPLLETVISVPVAERLPREHPKALCEAIEQARDIHCETDSGAFDRAFGETYFAGPIRKFALGVSRTLGHDALVQLLSRPLTTFTWHVCCTPFEKGDRMCMLRLLLRIVETETPRLDLPGSPWA